ncbi:MAG TPA: PspC domain-containing protein [archaeon]|nr:PspC domain-containing protein [archaeon]
MQVKAGVTPKDKTKKLYRSGKDKIFGGVCGGLAEYLGVDATLIRVIWAATMFLWGIGAGVYLLAWILIPRNPEHEW